MTGWHELRASRQEQALTLALCAGQATRLTPGAQQATCVSVREHPTHSTCSLLTPRCTGTSLSPEAGTDANALADALRIPLLSLRGDSAQAEGMPAQQVAQVSRTISAALARLAEAKAAYDKAMQAAGTQQSCCKLSSTC